MNLHTYSAPVYEMVIISGKNVSRALKINLSQERRFHVHVAILYLFSKIIFTRLNSKKNATKVDK